MGKEVGGRVGSVLGYKGREGKQVKIGNYIYCLKIHSLLLYLPTYLPTLYKSCNGSADYSSRRSRRKYLGRRCLGRGVKGKERGIDHG